MKVKGLTLYCKGCGKDQFQCDNGLCIPEEHVCDGIADCETGEDEQHNCCKLSLDRLKTKYCMYLYVFKNGLLCGRDHSTTVTTSPGHTVT